LTVDVDAIPQKNRADARPLKYYNIERINPALIDFFCRCKTQPAFISVSVATYRWLSVLAVIVANGIVAAHALETPGQYHASVLPGNINQTERGASIMQLARSVIGSV